MLVDKAVFPHLKDRGGAMLNFASAAGLIGYPGKSAYAASKGAVLSWNRSIAVEWGAHRITVNAIAPAIWTPMYDNTRSTMSPAQLAEHDSVEEDFVPVVAFLASEGARFITGQVIAIDGGMTMSR